MRVMMGDMVAAVEQMRYEMLTLTRALLPVARDNG